MKIKINKPRWPEPVMQFPNYYNYIKFSIMGR